MDDALAHARSVEADESEGIDRGAESHDWPRLSRLSDRLARARSAEEKLHERALPSPNEIRIKVEAVNRSG